MITAIRDLRRAKGLTLAEVAARCEPPTTAQTIGRLETGTRTVSVAWLNRIAAALGVTAAELVLLPERSTLPIVAQVASDGARALQRERTATPPQPDAGMVAIVVSASQGDYRAGDELWCDLFEPDRFGDALNRDVLAPRAAGRFNFGRLIGREGGRLQILPIGAGLRQVVVPDAPWLAVVRRLIRSV